MFIVAVLAAAVAIVSATLVAGRLQPVRVRADEDRKHSTRLDDGMEFDQATGRWTLRQRGRGTRRD